MKPSATTRAAALAFVTAAVALFMQVVVHRMISAKLMNNYAFLVISLTMLGFALSGVVLSRWRPQLLERFEDAATSFAALFVLSAVGATFLFYRLDVGHQFAIYRRDFLLHLGRWVPVALPYAVPFAFCGLILGMLLSDTRFSTTRVYFADLLGSALGAFAVIPAIGTLGAERSALAACLVLLVATLLLAPPSGRPARALAAAAGIVIVLAAARPDWAFRMTYPTQSMLWQIERLPKPYGIEYIAWDPVSRIEVSRIETPDLDKMFTPSLIGSNRSFHQRFRRQLTQNNWAFTYAVDYDGRRESLRGTEETVYACVYLASSVPKPKVLVIGVGGGFDVLTALYFDASEVTGVEVNAATIDILKRVYRSYFRNWVEDPRVRLVAAEGRHHLAVSDAQYDVIQLSGVDSYSGTPAAAHVFSESYLYTREAFDLYLKRLSPNGILSMMRPEYAVPTDMLRAAVMASEALRRSGAQRPADHIMMTAEPSGHYAALLVKTTPFSSEERERLARALSTNRYLRLVAAPGQNDPQGNAYQRFLSLGDPGQEARFVASYPFDVSAVEDNRPFFFRNSFWRHVLTSDPVLRAYALPVMEYTLLALLLVIGVAATLCVYLPLRLVTARDRTAPHALRYGVFFAATGLGYFAIEVGLLQKFGLFLGHPNYALSVVLAALLSTTGVGSFLSRPILRRVRALRFVSYGLGGIILVEVLLVLPRLAELVGLPFWTRCLTVLVLVAPVGIALGTFFPTALDQLKPDATDYVPWAWGINGIFSVLGPVLGVALSMTWGIDALLLAAVPVYLAAGLVLPVPANGR